MKLLIIRADGSAAIGTGHVMRMIALAQAWRRRGGGVIFCCAQVPKGLASTIVADEFELVRIDAEPGSEEDAAALISLANERGARAVACDNYHFDLAYQKAVSGSVDRFLMVADCGSDEGFACDFLLNQNLGISGSDYPALGGETELLAGSSYCLLREEFFQLRGKVGKDKDSEDASQRVLVTFGGADPNNATTSVIEALGRIGDVQGWEIKVVVGGANPHREEIESAAAAHSSCESLYGVSDMPSLIGWCDLAVSAAGSTVWELCFFGVPSALLSIADNQDGIVTAMGKSGAAIDLGRQADLDLTSLADQVSALLGDAERRAEMSSKAQRLVDGAGADRIAAALDGSLRITVATAGEGWVKEMLDGFVGRLEASGHQVKVVHEAKDIGHGDVAMFLSFWSLVSPKVLARNAHNLVVHASELPEGKGWSPMTWQILEGKSRIPLSLFEAQESVDSGQIYFCEPIEFEGHELLPELRAELMAKSYELCERFVAEYPGIVSRGIEQSGEETFYKRRGPADSELQPDASLVSQFDLLRTVDNDSYPAFFEHRGQRYTLRIEKANEQSE